MYIYIYIYIYMCILQDVSLKYGRMVASFQRPNMFFMVFNYSSMLTMYAIETDLNSYYLDNRNRPGRAQGP